MDQPVISVTAELSAALSAALSQAFGEEYAAVEPELRPCVRPELGDLQTNLPLRCAKPLGLDPQDVAERLMGALELGGVCEEVAFTRPGFLNLRLEEGFLAGAASQMLADAQLGVELQSSQRVVVDYVSANVAKPMHVGHLRSAVIGDALVRVLERLGHEVVGINHLGDWGTQFGSLVEYLAQEHGEALVVAEEMDLDALVACYREAQGRFEAGEGFADAARRRVVALQSGDRESLAVWEALVSVSLEAFHHTLGRLGVALGPGDVVGESFHNPALPGIVEELRAQCLLQVSGGAACVFVEGFQGRNGEALPLIVAKSDGGFGYAATDLAAIRHRVEELHAQRLVYVVDARQSLHFQQVFAVARAARWLPESVEATHVAFGTVLGTDGKPFKTRSGVNVSLDALLEEAVVRAEALLEARGTELAGAERQALAEAVGIGALKWADLKNELTRDYVFSYERMIALQGETGPYVQYAHARVCSLLSKAVEGGVSEAARLEVTVLAAPEERALALALLGYPAVLTEVGGQLRPHLLCGFLYDLASRLSRFYEHCPVLTEEGAVRSSRLGLVMLAKRVLGEGLGLLGLSAPERM